MVRSMWIQVERSVLWIQVERSVLSKTVLTKTGRHKSCGNVDPLTHLVVGHGVESVLKGGDWEEVPGGIQHQSYRGAACAEVQRVQKEAEEQTKEKKKEESR
jgi:hypothetical protein